MTTAGASSLADSLRFNTSIEELDVKYNRIGDQGAASICTSVLAHPSITSLNLSHNDILCTSLSARSAVRNLLRFNKSLVEFCITENFMKVDTREIVGYLVSAVLGARVTALGRVEWDTEGIDIPVQQLVLEKLQTNVNRVRGVPRTTETQNTKNTANGTNSRPTDSLDMGYSGYVEISMREINNSLQGANMSDITTLYLDHNTLFQIGQPVLQKLVSLRSLHLSHNRFETMPPSIKLLSNLTVLDLSHNRLSRFPKEVISLVRLQELDLSFNCIYSIGRDTIKNVGRLTSLWRISLHRNFLSQVPQILMTLPNITYPII
jgi:Leucine-rich repeat (LRR) protein